MNHVYVIRASPHSCSHLPLFINVVNGTEKETASLHLPPPHLTCDLLGVSSHREARCQDGGVVT